MNEKKKDSILSEILLSMGLEGTIAKKTTALGYLIGYVVIFLLALIDGVSVKGDFLSALLLFFSLCFLYTGIRYFINRFGNGDGCLLSILRFFLIPIAGAILFPIVFKRSIDILLKNKTA